MRLAQTAHRKTRTQFLRVSRERAAGSSYTPQSANSTKIRRSETRNPVQLLGKTSTVGHFSEKLNESGTLFAEAEPSAGPARRRQVAKECWMMKTPGHKLALQAETRNQRLRFPQSIQELEKPSNSGRFPDFLNPATRSNEHRKCRARQARYATRGERVRLQDTRRPFRSEAFPFACRTVQRTAQCVQRACERMPGPKARCASQGAKRSLPLGGFPVCKGVRGKEASKRKGPLEEGDRFSRGRAAESSRPRVGRRDCPFVSLRRRPSRT